tara:strand:+ start:8468 stop:9007 length:540 start_codon:yes stop_codon:yes gene_type:complete
MKKNRVLDCSVKFFCSSWRGIGVDRHLIQKAISAALDCNGSYINEKLALAVVLADDKFVQDHNKRFRSRDKPTNVLAFRQIRLSRNRSLISPKSEPIELGDVIIAYETVIRESKESSIPVKQHVSHLIIHGVLHLLGHDHQNEKDTKIMQQTEINALELIGCPNPYLNEIDVTRIEAYE